MDPNQLWSWVLTVFGLLGFIFAGKKIWWAWYINIANQFLWTAYAIVTEQWGFIVGSVFYFAVFSRNAYLWTKEHQEKKKKGVPPPKVGPKGPAGGYVE